MLALFTTFKGILVVVSPARPIYDPRFDAPAAAPREHGWSYTGLAGRLVQLEGAGDSAALTLAFTIVLEAQQCGEPVAWITPRPGAPAASTPVASTAGTVFYPPDVREAGIDLGAMPVVRVPGTSALLAAADVLLRSGGFGLIVADLGEPHSVESTSLARLAGLARRHHTALIFVTRSERGSLGSLISLYVRARRRRTGQDQFQCGLVVLKDKQRGPVWEYTELCRGAVGLR
jgi:recombination protein RecA